MGGIDEDEDVREEMQEESASEEESGGTCESQHPPPPHYDSGLDLEEIEGRMEESPQLDMKTHESGESNPSLTEVPRKPKLASSNGPELIGQNRAKDRIAGFPKRATKRPGGGKLLGGGSGGSAGFIA